MLLKIARDNIEVCGKYENPSDEEFRMFIAEELRPILKLFLDEDTMEFAIHQLINFPIEYVADSITSISKF